MKVSISVLGRFHAFYLAAQLAQRGCLEQLLTSYPRFAAERFGVPGERVESILAIELAARAHARLPAGWRRRFPADAALHRHFMQAACARLRPDADVFVGWSGVSLSLLERARSFGMRTVLERGSSHILAQTELLREEYARCGLRAELPQPEVIETELLEYERADRIAIPSRFVHQSFVERGVREDRLLLNPYGVSLANFVPPASRPRGFRLLHVGNVCVRKGAHHLMRAFREVNLPGAELVFVGQVAAHMRSFLERYAGPGLRCVGAVPQRELPGHYQSAHVFCLASIEDGLAMVVPQAMACGLPVLASHNTGAGDLLRDGLDGHLFAAGDLDTLKARIVELYEAPTARLALGAQALERVRTGHDWSNYGERALDLYRELLASDPLLSPLVRT